MIRKVILCSNTTRDSREINILLIVVIILLSIVRVPRAAPDVLVLVPVRGEDGQDDAAHVLGLGILKLATVKCSPPEGDYPGINPVFHLLQHSGIMHCDSILRISQICSTKMLFHVEPINEAGGAYFCTEVLSIKGVLLS